jgi:hypothetical protein
MAVAAQDFDVTSSTAPWECIQVGEVQPDVPIVSPVWHLSQRVLGVRLAALVLRHPRG